jgi:hypothetical protein
MHAQNYFRPVATALVLILGVSIWLGLKIPHGILTYPEE